VATEGGSTALWEGEQIVVDIEEIKAETSIGFRHTTLPAPTNIGFNVTRRCYTVACIQNLSYAVLIFPLSLKYRSSYSFGVDDKHESP
jgi:hypothetical protein